MPKSLSLNPNTRQQDPISTSKRLYRSFINEASNANDEDTKKQNLLKNSALYSGNVLVAASGLGLGYTAVHIVTLWDLYEEWAPSADDANLIAYLSMIPCFLVGLLHANIIYRKNYLYEKSKASEKVNIEKLKADLFELYNQLQNEINDAAYKVKNAEKTKSIYDKNTKDIKFYLENKEDPVNFDDYIQNQYADLIKYNDMQAILESLKKATRMIMLFTILFSLEFVGLGSFSEIMIAALVAGGIAGVIGYRAQDKENNHDIKPREQYEQQLALLEHHFAFKEINKNNWRKKRTQTADYGENVSSDLTTYLSNFKKDKLISKNYSLNPFSTDRNPHIYNVDNGLTAIGITSGYISLSWITMFAYHQHAPANGFYNNLELSNIIPAEFLLYGVPGFIAFIIDGVNIYRNIQLYQLYEKEAETLQHKTIDLAKEIEDLIKQYDFKPEFRTHIEALLKPSNNDDDNAERARIATFYKNSEAFKKALRVLTMTFLFSGSALTGSIAFMTAIIIVAAVIGYADYHWRQAKEEQERKNCDLRKEVLQLENIKKLVVDHVEEAPKQPPKNNEQHINNNNTDTQKTRIVDDALPTADSFGSMTTQTIFYYLSAIPTLIEGLRACIPSTHNISTYLWGQHPVQTLGENNQFYEIQVPSLNNR